MESGKGSAPAETPGVESKKLRVTRKVATAIAPPTAERRGSMARRDQQSGEYFEAP